MVDVDQLTQTIEIKTIYRIIHSENKLWNAIGKFYLSNCDDKFGEELFLCKCSDIRGLNLNQIPTFYKKLISTWSGLRKSLNMQNCDSRENILKLRLFGNSLIQHNKLPIYFQSFNKASFITIQDIWNEHRNEFQSTQYIFNKLTNRTNYLAEISIIKKAIPLNCIDIIKKTQEKSRTNIKTNINDKTLHLSDKKSTITVKRITHSLIHNINNSDMSPRSQYKWEQFLEIESDFKWENVWTMKQIPLFPKIIDFQWKSLHDILYTESRLRNCRLSNGKCHFCKSKDEDQIHLFFECPFLFTVKQRLNNIVNTILKNKLSVVNKASVILGSHYKDISRKETNLHNFIILIYKWTIWKIRNTIKYEGKTYTPHTTFKLLLFAIQDNTKIYLQSTTKHRNKLDLTIMESMDVYLTNMIKIL